VTVGQARAAHMVSKPIELLSNGHVLLSTLLYFKSVWIALVFGILIGAAVRVLVSPRWVARLVRGHGGRQQLTCAIAGSSLMLCSCCVGPVFSGVYEQGGGLGPSLGLMLASPGLNVAALVLTFALFPARLAVGRTVLALLAILVLAPLVGRWFGRGLSPKQAVCE